MNILRRTAQLVSFLNWFFPMDFNPRRTWRLVFGVSPSSNRSVDATPAGREKMDEKEAVSSESYTQESKEKNGNASERKVSKKGRQKQTKPPKIRKTRLLLRSEIGVNNII